MIHNVKILPQYFEPVVMGIKNFELRKDDREYQVCDLLVLKEWDPDSENYTGRETVRRISYKLKHAPGIEEGYCVLGIEECE